MSCISWGIFDWILLYRLKLSLSNSWQNLTKLKRHCWNCEGGVHARTIIMQHVDIWNQNFFFFSLWLLFLSLKTRLFVSVMYEQIMPFSLHFFPRYTLNCYCFNRINWALKNLISQSLEGPVRRPELAINRQPPPIWRVSLQCHVGFSLNLNKPSRHVSCHIKILMSFAVVHPKQTKNRT